MLEHQKRNDYKKESIKSKKFIDSFYIELLEMQKNYINTSSDFLKNKYIEKIKKLYQEIKKSYLYTNLSNLYCAILEDVNYNLYN